MAGLQVRAYNLLVAVLAAVTVTVAMRTVGLLLVSALMVVPVATSQQLARSFRTTLAVAMASASWPPSAGCCSRRPVGPRHGRPGPTIVLLALAMFASDLADRRLAATPAAPARALPPYRPSAAPHTT